MGVTDSLTRTWAADLEVRADGTGRTVCGIAVPYDRVADIGQYREVFRRGAFARTIQDRGSRVKLLSSHQHERLPVGRASLLREDSAGLYAEFKVSATPSGDEVITLVRDGAADSLSVGFIPVVDRWAKTEPLVERLEVKLMEVSVVAIGAYDDAKILAVRQARPAFPSCPAGPVAPPSRPCRKSSPMTTSMIPTLKQNRDQLRSRSRELLDVAEREYRDLPNIERMEYDSAVADIEAIGDRIEELLVIEQRSAAAGALLPTSTDRMPNVSAVSKANDAIADQFRSMILEGNPAPIELRADRPGAYYQPGLELRDTLKSRATHAMPVSAYDRVVMHMVENSAVMSGGATVITTRTGEDLQVPKSTAYVTSALTNEGASITESDPTLGVSTLKAYKFASFFQISRELANDSQSDLLGFLERQAGESLALAFGPYLITGTAQPQGIVTAAGTGKTGPTGTATSLGTQATAGQGTDCLYDLIGSVAEPYVRQASTGFIMTNASLMIARKLKDSAGQPVAAASGAPGGNTLLGFPAFVDPNVAAMAANAKSIIFGDLSRYFVRVSTASASRGRTNTPSSPIWSASAPSSGSTVRSSTRTA